MLFLNREDMKKCMNFDQCIEAMEKAYRILPREQHAGQANTLFQEHKR